MPDSTYNIVATFVGTDKVAAGFKKIQDEITKTSKMFIEGNKAQLKAVQSLGSEWKKMTSETSKIRTKGFEDATRGTRKLQQEQLKAIQEVSSTLKKNYDEEEKRRKVQEEQEKKNWAEKVNKAAEAAEKIKNVWKETSESIGKYAEAGMKVAESRDRLKSLIPDSGQYDKAAKAIQGVVTSLQGVKEADVTSTFADLYKSLGSTDKAAEALKLASEYQFAMASQFGEKFKPEQLQEQAVGGFEFLEKAGLAEDTKKAKEYFDVLTKLATFSKGDITAATLTPLLSSGFSLKGLKAEGLMTMALAMKEMGSSSGALASSLGGLQRGEIGVSEYGRTKLGIKSDQGLKKLFAENPLTFARTLSDELSKEKIDPGNIKALNAEIKKLFVGIGSDGAAAIAQFARLSKEMGSQEVVVATMAGTDETYSASLKNVNGQLQALKAAEENVKGAVGQGVLAMFGPIAQTLAPAIKALADFLAMHPAIAETAGALILVGKGLEGIIKTAAALKQSGAIDLIKALFATKAPNVAKEVSQEVAENVETEAAGASTAIAGTGTALGIGLGTTIVAGMGIGLAGLAIGEIIEQHLENEATKERIKRIGLEIGELLKHTIDLTMLEGLPDDERKYQAALYVLNQVKELAQKHVNRLELDKGPPGWWSHGWGAQASDAGALLDVMAGRYGLTTLTADLINRVDKEASKDPQYSTNPVAAQDRAIPKVLADMIAKYPIGNELELEFYRDDLQKALITGNRGDQMPVIDRILAERYPDQWKQMQDKEKANEQLMQLWHFAPDPQGRIGQDFQLFLLEYQKNRNELMNNTAELKEVAKKLPALKTSTTVSSRAGGGIVQRGGLVNIHAGEAIVPARVTDGLGPGGIGGIHFTNSPSIVIHGTGVAEQRELRRLLDQHAEYVISRIDRRMRDRALSM